MTLISTAHMNSLYVEIAPQWLAFLETEQARIDKELQRLKADTTAESKEDKTDALDD